MHAFGAHFVEVRVDSDTGEVRVPRCVGVFDAGRIVNPKTARSQFLGGLSMGLSMALHEESVTDPRFGHYVNHDLAEYHVATNADIGEIDVHWLDDPTRTPTRSGARASARSASPARPPPSPTPSTTPPGCGSATCPSPPTSTSVSSAVSELTAGRGDRGGGGGSRRCRAGSRPAGG